MTCLIISADIHGSLSTWITIKTLTGKGNGLVVAGDLFGTRYGRLSDPDFSPEAIKQDLKHFNNPFYYVYGNCDIESFFPGAALSMSFEYRGIPVFLHHGHRPDIIVPGQTRLIIQGHTHRSNLEKKNGIIHMNPGSLTAPRDYRPTYGMITRNQACLMDIRSSTPLSVIDLKL